MVEGATARGATILLPVENQVWGDRVARVSDPAGHVWTVATRAQRTRVEERPKPDELLAGQAE